ncbi:hypothetical protein BDD43_0354 [Mucilaginibacter gracilis]|uniref:Uncharacterized protein n=1 Tax=Mucilaginibacter gracilis TaxID=423350 RepID=A0A495IW76_9SPHI|nr:hypothetical protein BDD43_0354 [Mucilaginibacter gracilis]
MRSLISIVIIKYQVLSIKMRKYLLLNTNYLILFYYSSSNLNFDKFIPKDKPFDLTRS